MELLVRSALLGAAAGARSVTPIAVLAPRRPTAVRIALAAAAAGEMVADKLPGTPSRVAPAPLAGRIVLGAVSGAVYARRRGGRVVVPALVAAASAVAAAYAGAGWRAFAASHSFALPAALAEDVAAVALAWTAAKPSARVVPTPAASPAPTA